EAVSEMIRSGELARALCALAAAGMRGVLMKGAALAHTIYASPCLRPRADADLLVHERDREAAERVLARCGYTRAPRIAGKRIEYQAPYYRDAHGLRHVIDLHWRVFNRQVLADRFPFDELAARAVRVPAIAEAARALDPVDALLVACLHAPAHHRGQRRPLVEAYDAHRLASDFAPDDWRELARRAAARGVRRLCLRGLREAQRRFGTALPGHVVDAFSDADSERERSARLLGAGRSDPFWNDVRAIPGWTGRLRFLYEAAFPSAAFVSHQYGVRSRALLPLLYLHRGVTGLFRRSLAR
ncbi:MAG: nucleotidyltransferase family protein, partial [Deltaproteobacteria bacterium]